MAGLSFAFNPDEGETPDTLAAKRAIAMALMSRSASSIPHNAGEGLALVGNRLAAALAMSNFENASQGAYKQFGDAMTGLLSPAPTASTAPAVPAAPGNVPDASPSIPSAALSGAGLADTPAPLSGGIPPAPSGPQSSAALTDAVAKLESGGRGVNGPAGRYVNELFQQFPAFAKQYGTGADGVVNYAKQVLAANPNATFGDMYGGYVTGTGNPASAAEASLRTTTQPGARAAYANLVRNSPVDPRTPLAKLLGALGPTEAQADEFNPATAQLFSPNATMAQPLQSPVQNTPGMTPPPEMGILPYSGNAPAPAAPANVPLPAARPDAAPATFDQRFGAMQPPTAQASAAPVQVASLGGGVPAPSAPADPRQQVAQALMQAPVGQFGDVGGPQPNVTTLPVRPTQLPISDGRAAVAQALAGRGQPQAAPAATPPVAAIPPQVAATIRRLSMIPLPQAQTMAATLMQQYMRPHTYGFTTAPDGTVLRTDSLTGSVAPVYQGGGKPTPDQLNYQYYLKTVQPGQQPMDFATWATAKARAGAAQVNNNIDMGGPQSYDKQLAEGLAKSHVALVTGVEEAQQRARDIAAMQGAIDQIQKNGGTTGGMGQAQVLGLLKTINAGASAIGVSKPFNEADISDKEFLQKFNRQMAGAQAKGAVGARVTNFEMQNFLKSNPGLDMSITGNQRLLGIQAQIEQRNIAVGNAIRQATAQYMSQGKRIDPVTVQKIITDYDNAHHIRDPLTGQDLTQSYVLPEFQTQGANPQKAQQHQQNIDDLVKKYAH